MNKIIIDSVLKCPVCDGEFELRSGSLLCENGHCFDLASAGYVNLADPKHSGTGDSKELVTARTGFLSAGYYAKFSDAVCGMCKKYAGGGIIIDAGCGEGYYTVRAAKAANAHICGFDLSKCACNAAAKLARREGADASFAVSGIFNMPVRSGCADAVINLFAPCAPEEFARVLKPGGYLIVAGAGERHLEGLKNIIYDKFIPNTARADLPSGDAFEQTDRQRIHYNIVLENRSDIMSLFSMTPYYYRTDAAGRERLEKTERLATEADFDIYVYRKKAADGTWDISIR